MATIYKRNKVWYVDYRIDGRRVRKRVGPSKKVAELELKNIEVKLAKGEIGIFERNKKINEYVQEFTRFLEVNKKPKTKQRYLEVLSHFQDFLSNYPHITLLAHIQSRVIEEYKQRRIEHIMPKTVNFELGFLNYFFNLAIKYNYLLKNPVAEVEKLRLKKKQPRFLSKEEIRLIIENCTRRLYPIFLTFLYSGMRKDELRNLEWSDLDFDNRLIRVRVKDFWEPKNGLSRNIPMKDELYRVLKKLERRSTWAFSTESGNQVRHLRRDLVRLCNSLGIKNVNLHTLRHTFASHMVMSGVDLPTVQKLLGHKDINTTMIYSHLAPDHLKHALKKLEFQ